MEQFYTDERNVQILIALLKKHGIKHIVASPGSTNVTFVGSVQQDSFFEIYSCVDERSAAYMACGLAAEIMQPVVLSCTGATASRNYFPALTEAYYRKLPVLAVTSTQEESKIGQLIPQVIDRSIQPADTVKMSVHLQTVKDDDDQWNVMLKANMAILELNHRFTHFGEPGKPDFKLFGEYFFPVFCHDHSLYPADDTVMPFVVNRSKISGMKPALRIDSLRGRLRVVIISEHHVRTLYGQLAHTVLVDIDQFRLQTAQRLTDIFGTAIRIIMHYTDR